MDENQHYLPGQSPEELAEAFAKVEMEVLKGKNPAKGVMPSVPFPRPELTETSEASLQAEDSELYKQIAAIVDAHLSCLPTEMARLDLMTILMHSLPEDFDPSSKSHLQSIIAIFPEVKPIVNEVAKIIPKTS